MKFLISVVALFEFIAARSISKSGSGRDGSNSISQSRWVVGQGVNTTSGFVIGHAASNRTGVSEYLGIRFAQAPVGSLRWAAPVRYKGIGTINATEFVSRSPNKSMTELISIVSVKPPSSET
jgi:hypothetical protein